MITMEPVEGAVAIDICEPVLSSVQQKLNAVRDELMAADNFNIFRVPAHVRRSDKHLHKPRMVAIGPYGRREEPSLRAMEHHKLRYLHDFLSRRNTTIEDCVAEIKELEHRARRCYCDPFELSAEKFAEILLFDGCFIIELLTKLYKGYDARKRIANCSLPYVLTDLLLLDNQIPLFVLDKLFKIDGTADTPVQRPEIPSLREHLVKFLKTVTVMGREEEIEISNEQVEGNNDRSVPGEAKDFHHLLHLYYDLYVTKPQTDPTGCTNCGTILKWLNPSRLLSYVRSKTCRSNKKRLPGMIPSTTELPEAGETIKKNRNQKQNQNRQTEPTGATIYGIILKRLNPSRVFTLLKRLNPSRVFTLLLPDVRSKTCKSNKKRFPGAIPSATELLEAGVTIKKKKNQNQNQNRLSSFLDVTFCPRHGVLEIPFLSVDDNTLPLFSNLVAFEQCGGCKEMEDYMSSYAAFMDCLVNTPEDEAILRQHGILENNLASDEHLAVFFNQLSEWIVVDSENHYLAKLFQEVGEYCGSPWHKWRAKLVRDYFSNPWAIISLMAAAVLLILTILQTVYSILSYDK